MNAGEYVCFDLGKLMSGVPRLTVNGSAGDVVNLVFAESCSDGIPRALHPLHGRRSMTLILKDGRNQWEGFFPSGLRYLYVMVCESVNALTIDDVEWVTLQKEDETRNKFECPDVELNNIWENSVSTLRSCSEFCYMDSPSGRRAQFLRDAAFQSMYSMCTSGDISHAKRALYEFASSQYETGELPSVYPSSYVYTVGEWSMYWVIWRHTLSTWHK